MPLVAVLLACAPGLPSFGRGGVPQDPLPTDTGADDTGTTGTTDPTTPPEPVVVAPVVLPSGLAVDAVELTVEGELGNEAQPDGPDGSTTGVPIALAGVEPTTLVTWYQAVAVCENAGKHLCTWGEWAEACAEGTGRTYPWGEEADADTRCALAHPDGSTSWGGLVPTAFLSECRTEAGVYDQVGNAWEWVDLGEVDADGVPVPGKVGGAWYAGYGAGGCPFEPNREHPPDFRGTIGFRCCAQVD